MQNLEDYIVEMENRKVLDVASSNCSTVPEEFWTLFKQKEQDLVLAAEFGNALLEKNEELKGQLEAKETEFAKKLEILEQDRHQLKRKLASIESECELRVLELQNDVKELEERLHQKEIALKQIERDKGNLFDDLQKQNARLAQELKRYATNEIQIAQQVDELRQQNMLQKKNTQDYATTINSLKDEIEMAQEKRNDLERRLRKLNGERDELALNLEEANDRITQLEREKRENNFKYYQQEREMNNERDEMLSINIDQQQNRSILAEMDLNEQQQTNLLTNQECMSIYRQMNALYKQLKSHNDFDDDSGLHSDCCSTISFEDENQQQHFSIGLLIEIAQQLVSLVVDSDVVNLIERIERYRRDLQERDDELQRKNEIIRELTSRVSVCEVELQATIEERDRARNDVNSTSSTAHDEIVAKAREIRDQAVSRRKKAEVELAKTRMELMQANSLLLQAIQQKVDLNKKLEQWETDMQEFLDEQLKKKLTSQEIKMKNYRNQQQEEPVAPRRRKLLGFFQR